jgi:hypothetical protein
MASHVPNRGPELLAVDILFMSLAVISNALRCYVRIRMVKAFGLDDWLMSLATVSVQLLSLRLTINDGIRSSSSDMPSPRSSASNTARAGIMRTFQKEPSLPRDIAGGTATSSTAARQSFPSFPLAVFYYASRFASYTPTSSTPPWPSQS